MSKISLNKNTLQILKERYLRANELTWDDLCDRVSTAIADAELTTELKQKYQQLYYSAMSEMLFIPSTPCLINADIENPGQLSSCFIIDLKDNIESIYEAKGKCAKIFQTNGGVGFNISVLRPKDTNVETAKGKSCGTIGFMEEFNLTADIVTRNNIRKGAIKIDLNDWHPDILDFISCKDDVNKLNYMNISVNVSDKFMNAVENDELWALEFPLYSLCKKEYNLYWNGDLDDWKGRGLPVKIYSTIKARDLYSKIIEHSWLQGEPGLTFRDVLNRENPNPHLGKIFATNPCMEFNSQPYNSCNLGSINLSLMYDAENKCIDYQLLEETIKMAVRFLDDMIDVNILPLKEISDFTKAVRSIGLGTMGFSDLLYQLGVEYGSGECLNLINVLYGFIKHVAITESTELAKEKGTYALWENSVWNQKNIKIRNSNLISIAPNGSISFIANCSGGIEPNFALIYNRKTNDGTIYSMTNPFFIKALDDFGISLSDELVDKIIENNGSCQGIPEIPKRVQNIFVTALDIAPQKHLDVLEGVQKHVDLSISKTINLPNDYTVEDLKNIYMDAYKKNIKGVTVYRDNSRDSQTLSTKNQTNVVNETPLGVINSEKEGFVPVQKVKEIAPCIRLKIKTGCGSMWLILVYDENGKLIEIFSQSGSNGGCSGLIEALSRIISLNLKANINPRAIIEQLKSVKCNTSMNASKKDKTIGRSCGDGIARQIEGFLNGKFDEYMFGYNLIKNNIGKKSEIAEKQEDVIVFSCNHDCSHCKSLDCLSAYEEEDIIVLNMSNKCPNCGEQLRNECGCRTCPSCLFSFCN